MVVHGYVQGECPQLWVNRWLCELASLPDALESSAPPCERLIKAHEKGGDREGMHGQGPLI